MVDYSLESISRQIAEIEEQLLLFEERKADFIISTDIPLQLIQEEREKKARLEELRNKKAELEKQLAQEKVTKPTEKKLKVYISSTSEDLTEHRAVSRFAINEANCEDLFLKNFGPETEYNVGKYEATLQKCDVVILLFAFQFGYAPAPKQGGTGDSITVLELDYARQYDKKVLIFLANEDEHWSHDTDGESIKKFRSGLGKPDGVFGYEASPGQDFRDLVINVLKSYKEELLKKQTPLENFPIASGMLLSGECIPFLGPGVYGDGPLSICALRKALGDESCNPNCKPESCQKSSLATVAEFHELSPKRWLFLKELSRRIDEQIRDVTTPPIYDLIKQIKPKPPLIISASLDLLLEESLSAGGPENCLILCHAIRSKDKEKGTPKGVLVFKGPKDQSPMDHPANAIPELVALEEGGKTNLEGGKTPYIVYKPFGSPLLPCPGIDTVVITEEDYQILLNLLGSVETGVPAAFTKIFKRYPPIFLGYPLDVWHYRLMGQLLKSITPSDNAPFYAVRRADLSLEQKAWDGLLVKLVSMDVGEFSQEVNKALQKERVTR